MDFNKPDHTMISDLPASITTDTANADNISSGVLKVAQGGTGTGSYTTGQVLVGESSGALGKYTLVGGNNMNVRKQGSTLIVEAANTNGTGSVGFQGMAGADGATGASGTTGLTGATGLVGATGPQGSAGATGPQGATGFKGATGATGLVGATGPSGTNGATGSAGTNSIIGATGIKGSPGSTGVAGLAGIGATGAVGATGPIGATGPQGPIGITGGNGALGVTGQAFGGISSASRVLHVADGVQTTFSLPSYVSGDYNKDWFVFVDGLLKVNASSTLADCIVGENDAATVKFKFPPAAGAYVIVRTFQRSGNEDYSLPLPVTAITSTGGTSTFTTPGTYSIPVNRKAPRYIQIQATSGDGEGSQSGRSIKFNGTFLIAGGAPGLPGATIDTWRDILAYTGSTIIVEITAGSGAASITLIW